MHQPRPSPPSCAARPCTPALGPRTAAALAFGSAAAVLVVEIVALRLLAPYLGLTLETSTMVIGIALTAIALGSWLGGLLADRIEPRLLIAPALGVSGAVVAFTPAALRAAAERAPVLPPAVALDDPRGPGALLAAVIPRRSCASPASPRPEQWSAACPALAPPAPSSAPFSPASCSCPDGPSAGS
ncbi:hypothetical protein SSPIM334S_07251 [Streptomyces spiroverticillatus]